MTYELLFPFLKDFHLTLSQHLPCRDEEGWKIKEVAWIAFCHRENISLGDESIDYPPPTVVKPVPRFFKCLQALKTFFLPTIPPIVTDRSLQIFLVLYGFADASKSGFGASLQTEHGLRYRIETWDHDDDTESSNFREFENVVCTLEEEVEQGRLHKSMIITATDNSTVESALYKGNSSSEKLFDLVVRFRSLEL